MLISRLFETITVSAVSVVHWYSLKKYIKIIDVDGPLLKCAYQAFIIQNLDVMTLELSMKVQFANFLTTWTH
jgi:hypothetical protein